MCNIYYFGHITGKVNEGGMARNSAFFAYFKTKEACLFNLYDKNIVIRGGKLIHTIFKLFLLEGKTIFIHQGTILLMFPIFIYKYRFVRQLVCGLFNMVSKKNKLIVEVNDMPYEQSIDLGLAVDKTYQVFQNDIYSLDRVRYVFASFEMESHIQEKYKIEKYRTQTIINGGPDLKIFTEIPNNADWIKNDKLKFVYAGGLNKGRQIENLISIFKNKTELLILLGSDGEWLREEDLSENIIYLGAFEERLAHFLVSKCDMGIIPYDEHKFYYNLCYPTKASFYITARIPFLSTPLKELENNFSSHNIAVFSSIAEWDECIKTLNSSLIQEMKAQVLNYSKTFNWTTLLSKLEI